MDLAVPVLFAAVSVVNFAETSWDEWGGGVVAVLLLGTLMVGFGDEIVFRGSDRADAIASIIPTWGLIAGPSPHEAGPR